MRWSPSALRWMLMFAAMAGPLTAAAQARVSAAPAPSSAGDRERDLVILRARELLATGDTAASAAYLRDAAAASPNDGLLWHEYGMLLSRWTRAHWRKGTMPSGVPQRIIAAESSLARAMRLEPDSASYAIDYANQLFGSNFTSLEKAKGTREQALDLAESRGDTLSVGTLSDGLGMLLWRRYEPMANRRYEILSFGFTDADYVQEPYKFRMYIDEATRLFDPPLGVSLYLESLEYFRRARALLPDDETPFRHEAMALAERGRWDELELVARQRTRLRPAQTWPWMALGLAEHRRGQLSKAGAAFDSGFSRLPSEERARLMSLKRLLPTPQLAFFDTLDAARREQLTDMYWDLANPTLLLDGNPVLNEFRARVVHAELQWTNEEYQLKGADTDRGEIFIRWGPPDEISTHDIPYASRLTWMYRRIGLNFRFNAPPTLGTARITQFYRSFMLEPNMARRPAIWENVPVMRRGVDSLPVQVARFRSRTDSIDVAVFAGIRAGALRAGMPTDTTVLKTGVFAIDAAGRVQSRVSDAMRTGEQDTLVLTSRRWRMRVPASAAYVRVEALETDALRVARAIREVSGFATRGFGSSDVLIGTRITAPTSMDTARWSDFTIAPVNGNAVKRGQPLELLWEVYEPTLVDGAARYRVSIAVQRAERRGLVGVAARVAGGVRDAVVRAGGNDRVAVEYDRLAVGGPIRTEYLRLDLGSARAGRYLLTVTVRDLHGNRTISRQREIVLD